MQYLLTGFTQNTGVRVFVFEGVAADWVRTAYSVSADLPLARKHGIQMQELPLLCRGVLEQRGEDDDRRAFTFTEGDMTLHAGLVRAALELSKKKAPRRPFAAAATASASAAPIA
jgi:hypothetical protein